VAAPRGGNSRRGLVIAGVLVGLVALLVIGGIGAWALLGNHKSIGNTPGGSGGVTTTQSGAGQTGGQTNADLVDLQCNSLVGKNVQPVEKQLVQQGFTVKRVSRAGGHKGRVVAVSPCPTAPRGSEVTLVVATGADGGDNPTGGPSSAPSCGIGIGANVSCTSAGPQSDAPVSPNASGPGN
jgi:hypothetical protein